MNQDEQPAESSATRQIPQFKCHKVVGAITIKEITLNTDGSATITPVEEGYGPFLVDAAYVERHKPWVGGRP